MKKNGKNEELQSRREFFKRAAKGALPILAGAALLSSPILSETANAMSCAGCNNRCMNSCFNTLKSYIYNSVAELRNNFSVTVSDYWWSGVNRPYGHYKDSHYFEGTLTYCFGDSFPLALSWSTMFAGADKSVEGKLQGSTYINASYH